MYVEVRLVPDQEGVLQQLDVRQVEQADESLPAAEEPQREALPEPPPEPLSEADAILATGERQRLERRTQQLAEQEQALRSRIIELDRREDGIARREAELEAAFGLREDRIEQREAELADAQARLDRREQELTSYVTRLQAEFSRRG